MNQERRLGHSQSYSKSFRLLKKRDFNGLREKSSVFLKKGPFIAFYRLREEGFCDRTRLGISCSKKIGKAVVRNRIKRMIKERFRTSPYRFKKVDLLVVLRQKTKILNLRELQSKERYILKNLEFIFQNVDKDRPLA